MKRFITIILTIFMWHAVNGQQILRDETTEYGQHFVATTMMPVYDGPGQASGKVSLGIAYNESMQTFFSLNLELSNEEKTSIREGNTLQLVTYDGEIILLRNTLSMDLDKYNVDNNGYNVIISYGVQYNEKELADLDHIMNERIVKIRIETDDSIIERKIEDNSFSKSVYSCFQVLKNHLENKKL